MDPLATLLSDAEQRRARHMARYVAFMAEHSSQDIGDLSREESFELFSILLAAAGLDAELRVLRNLIGRFSP
jgi:hypothetical protein